MDSHVLYGSSDKEGMLTVEAAYFLIKNIIQTSQFYASFIKKAARLELTYLKELYTRFVLVDHTSF